MKPQLRCEKMVTCGFHVRDKPSPAKPRELLSFVLLSQLDGPKSLRVIELSSFPEARHA